VTGSTGRKMRKLSSEACITAGRPKANRLQMTQLFMEPPLFHDISDRARNFFVGY
jgi:hypothetical protein